MGPRSPWSRRRAAVVAVVVSIAAAASCSDGETADPTTSASTSPTTTTEAPAELAGTSWRLVVIERDGASVDADGEVPAVVSFTEDGLEGYDGVNTATASYEVDGDELDVESLSSTEIAAAGPELPQYELFELLERAGTVELDDGRLLLGVGGSTTLVFEQSAGGITD